MLVAIVVLEDYRHLTATSQTCRFQLTSFTMKAPSSCLYKGFDRIARLMHAPAGMLGLSASSVTPDSSHNRALCSRMFSEVITLQKCLGAKGAAAWTVACVNAQVFLHAGLTREALMV